jgi:ABC-type nitrate/sulfonate/bicarbonate transport system ATPase subunit
VARRPNSTSGSPAASPAVASGTEAAATPWIEVRDVVHVFGDVHALDAINLSVEQHARLALVGPSGCGKSTLLSILAGLTEASAGVVRVGGAADARGRLARCALMPQKDLLLPWRSALDNACLALENKGESRADARQRTRPLFERFGLAQFEDELPARLSGGMRQRVAFLRTLMAGKEVLLLDEPFGALDSITRGQMQDWLADALNQEPRTVVLVTHDVEEALVVCDRVVVLSARPGRIVRTIDVDIPRHGHRRDTVTTPEFVHLREQALEALEW